MYSVFLMLKKKRLKVYLPVGISALICSKLFCDHKEITGLECWEKGQSLLFMLNQIIEISEIGVPIHTA